MLDFGPNRGPARAGCGEGDGQSRPWEAGEVEASGGERWVGRGTEGEGSVWPRLFRVRATSAGVQWRGVQNVIGVYRGLYN